MPGFVEWGAVQRHLVRRGLLAEADVEDVATSGLASPALQAAVAGLGNAASGMATPSGLNPIVVTEPGWFSDIVRRIQHRLNHSFCGFEGVPATGGDLHALTFGAPRGRWTTGAHGVFIDTTGCNFVDPSPTPTTPADVIWGAFDSWQQACGFFTFTRVFSAGAASFIARFGGLELSPRFTGPDGVLATGGYPNGGQRGQLSFDAAETWTPDDLRFVALHEIGHTLGLDHSDDITSLLFATDAAFMLSIDAETRRAINSLYGWRPQARLPDRGTTDRPALAYRSGHDLASKWRTPMMAWKGAQGDAGIYWSQLVNGAWDPQSRVPGVGCSASPALTEIPDPASGGLYTSVLMAWKGVAGDPGIYWARWLGDGWSGQARVQGVGASTAPALATLNGTAYMAWKGVGDDPGLYWSRWRNAGGWSPQQRVAGVGTTGSPALATLGGRLYMFWRGVAGDSNIWFSSSNYNLELPWTPQQRVSYMDFDVPPRGPYFPGTSGGITAASLSDRIFLAWKGVAGDQSIWFSFFRNGAFDGQARVAGVGTSTGPAAVSIDDRIVMAWKGVEGDDTLWWSSL